MSAPEQDAGGRHAEEVAKPTVSTAPAAPPTHRWWSAIPSHLGRARTSTVVLAVLFVGIFFLYLEVKPPVEGSVTEETGVDQPVVPAPSTTTPPSTTEPEPTTEEEDESPTSTPPPTRTSAPTSEPEPSIEPELPTTTTSTDAPGGATAPTTVSPPG
ncbi:hypothetical protein DQ237_05195 [Blastococcus sp. TF02-8]|uniref:hypothetical protein n=1 Tax=Blastococcus sp. TF02-8 TaxID=2250574 RepID=UPI000DEA961F|nr:hypothetical protein [Blastococcus sp. TF02-8]RBY96998.1 hypothetical protein DQ237_05195 [Blastococcus sp. TF02-8]